MSFAIRPDGTIEVSTPDELRQALQITDELHRSRNGRVAVVSATANQEEVERPRPDRDAVFRQFYEQSPNQHQKLLRALLEVKEGKSDGDLRAVLGLSDNVALRGVLISLSRRAANVHLASPIVRHMTRTNGGK